MAVKEDYENLAVATRRWSKSLTKAKNSQQVLNVSMCSPDEKQRQAVINNFITLPVVSVLRENNWNLDESYPANFPTPYVIVACNVFHYALDPQLWFHNCFKSCVELWVQDLLWRPRGATGELGYDGDKCRYGLGGRLTIGEANYFDLGSYFTRLLDYWVYDAGSLRSGRTVINFMARFRGDL